MGEITERFAQVWRDFLTAGIPASGEHEPSKAEIRAIGPLLETVLATVGVGVLRFATVALRDADTGQDDGTLAYVYNNNDDPNDAANGYYQWDDAGNAWVDADWLYNAYAGVVVAAEAARDEAEAARDEAEAARDEAEAWASTIEDTEVPGHPGEYSAPHWAAKAAASAILAALEAAAVVAINNSAKRSSLIAQRVLRARVERSKGKRGRIYATIGQSLSVRRDYTAGQPKVDWTSPFAYQPVGGADRNLFTEVVGNVAVFTADGANFEALEPFEPDTTRGGKIDGFAMMADVPTVLGIYAIGARDYSELEAGRAIFYDMGTFMSSAVKLLRDLGCAEIEIVYSFAHGESETDNLAAGGGPGVPTTKAQYKLQMHEWFRDLAWTAKLALDDPDYEPIVLVHQMGGVFNEAWTEIMRAQREFCDSYAHAHLTGPTAPYGFQADRTHPPGEAQALMGEWDWHLVDRVKANLPTALLAQPARHDGTTIYVPTNWVGSGVQVDITAANPNMTDASGFNGLGTKVIYGVETFVAGVGVALSNVDADGTLITIELAGDPGGAALLEPRFGMAFAPGGNAAVPANTSRVNIRAADFGIPSRYQPAVVHRMWLLHDKVPEAV